MIKILQAGLAFFLMGILVSCETVSGVAIKDQEYSLIEIRRSIAAIAGKPREVSENEREIITGYFGRKIGAAFDPNTAKERLYAHFWILGDRRPYEIHVQVISEVKTSDGYSENGEDAKLSRKVAEELKAKLAQGQDGSNVIDSFRPF